MYTKSWVILYFHKLKKNVYARFMDSMLIRLVGDILEFSLKGMENGLVWLDNETHLNSVSTDFHMNLLNTQSGTVKE